MPAAAEGPVTVVMVPREKYHLAPWSLSQVRQAAPDAPVIYVDEARVPRRLRRWARRTAAADPAVSHLPLSHPAGANECRARGAALATTPYLLFLDNDAHPLPGAIEALVDCADSTGASFVAPVCLYRDGRVHHVGGPVDITDGPSGGRLVEAREHHGEAYDGVRHLLERSPIGAPELHGVLVRRSSLAAAGGVDTRLIAAMDCLDLGFRLGSVDGGGWQEPSAVVVYDDRRPRRGDLRLYAGRWARATVEADIARFAAAWRIDPSDPRLGEHRAFLEQRRRRGFRAVRAPLRRIIGERSLVPVDRALDAVLDRATAGSRRTR